MSVFKPKLADALIEGLASIRQRFEEISEDAEYVRSLMAEGSERTLEEAQNRMKLLKTVIGLYGSSVSDQTLQRRIYTLSILFSRPITHQQAYRLQEPLSTIPVKTINKTLSACRRRLKDRPLSITNFC